MQYHDFSDFSERYLQSDSAYDIIPNIEKGVYSRYEVNSKTFILGQRATVWNKSLFLFYKEWSSIKKRRS